MRTILLSLPFLAACAAPSTIGRQSGDWEARLSAVVAKPTINATVDHRFLGQTLHVAESHSGTVEGGRLELNQSTDTGETIGFYADVGYGSSEGADLNSASAGIIGRGYLTASPTLRTFLETRIGYSETWLGTHYGDGIEAGAALGVELALSRRVALTLAGGWDYATIHGDGWTGSSNGPTANVGLSLRF